MKVLVNQLVECMNIQDVCEVLHPFSSEEVKRKIKDSLKEIEKEKENLMVFKKYTIDLKEEKKLKEKIKKLKEIENLLLEYRTIYLTKEEHAKQERVENNLLHHLTVIPDTKELLDSYKSHLSQDEKRSILSKLNTIYLTKLKEVTEAENIFLNKVVYKMKQTGKKDMKIKQWLLLDEQKKEQEEYEKIMIKKHQFKSTLSNILKLNKLLKEKEITKKELDFKYSKEEKDKLNEVKEWMSFIESDAFSIKNSNLTYDVSKLLSSIVSNIENYDEKEQSGYIHLIRKYLKEKISEYKILNKKTEVGLLQTIRMTFKTYLIAEKEKKDCHYDILAAFFDSNFNYAFVEAFIREIPDFLSSKKEEHILFLVLDNYFKNSKLKLANQGLTYVDPTYFYKIFTLFYECGVILSKEEEEKIKQQLDEFYLSIVTHGYKDASNTLDEVIKMKESMQQEEKKEETHQEISYDEYRYPMYDFTLKKRVNLVFNYLEEVRKKIQNSKTSSIDEYAKLLGIETSDILNAIYSNEPFFIEGGKYAYSFSYSEKGDIYFRIHALDLRFLPYASNVLDRVRENAIYGFIHNDFPLKKDTLYPMITFQFKLELNGLLSELKYYESKLSFKKIYQMKDFKNYREDSNLKNFVSLIYRMNFDSELKISNIENFLDTQISDSLIRTNTNKKFLYKQIVIQKEDQLLQNHFAIAELLQQVSKSESNLINEIIRRPLSITYTKELSEDSNIDMSSSYAMYLLEKELFHPLEDEFFDKEVEAFNSTVRYVPKHFTHNPKYFKQKV